MKAAARRQAAGALKLIRCGGIKPGREVGRQAGCTIHTGWICPQNACKLTAASTSTPAAWPGVGAIVRGGAGGVTGGV